MKSDIKKIIAICLVGNRSTCLAKKNYESLRFYKDYSNYEVISYSRLILNFVTVIEIKPKLMAYPHHAREFNVTTIK